jgi:hypothetical protein
MVADMMEPAVPAAMANITAVVTKMNPSWVERSEQVFVFMLFLRNCFLD